MLLLATVKWQTVVAVSEIAWVICAGLTAAYGYKLGYPFFPLFLFALFVPFFGWLIVLLAVTIGAGNVYSRTGATRRNAHRTVREERRARRDEHRARREARRTTQPSARAASPEEARAAYPAVTDPAYDELTAKQARAGADALRREAACEGDSAQRAFLEKTADALASLADGRDE
jgi:hypothetical protein